MSVRTLLTSRALALPTGCVVWTGLLDRDGYGLTRVPGDPVPKRVARLAYEAWVGPIPEGYEIDHLCRVRACLHPGHLDAVTKRENNRRRAAAVTHCPAGHEHAVTSSIRPNGSRRCRPCDAARHREGRASR